MDKILVEIKCPATSKDYEFRVSKKLIVKEGKEKILSEIRIFENNEKLFHNNISILNGRTGKILNPDMSFIENGVISGDKLMII